MLIRLRSYCPKQKPPRRLSGWIIWGSHGTTSTRDKLLYKLMPRRRLPRFLPATLRSFPNPFSHMTRIRFAIPEQMHVRMAVYDVRGRLVATIVNGQVGPGVHTALWDGNDHHGKRVASGLYFCRLVAGDQIRTRKMMMLR